MFYWWALLVFLVDRGTKYWVSRTMMPGETIPLWPGVFHITYYLNAGAAFSILQNQRWLFIAITLAVIAGILYAETRVKRRAVRCALALLLGGALGNLWDRVTTGKVVDFIDVRLIHYPIFNMADSVITIAVVWMAADALLANRGARGERKL